MPIQVADVCADFLAFWAEGRDQPPARQLGLWRQLYEEPNRALFDLYYSRYGTRGRAAQVLDRLVAVGPTVRATAPRVAALVERVAPRCADLLGVADHDLRYVLMVGLFQSVAWQAEFEGAPTSFLALETEPNQDLAAVELTLAHETAHALHGLASGIRAEGTHVGEGLLWEGIAVVTTVRLCPGRPEAAYLSPAETTDVGQTRDEWLAACDRRGWELRERLLADLDRDDVRTFAAYFWEADQHAPRGLPPRAGYVVGYRLVEALLDRHHLAEVVRWPPERARTMVRQALETVGR
jgi:Predicted Zn-dependent protease (DUF2268)